MNLPYVCEVCEFVSMTGQGFYHEHKGYPGGGICKGRMVQKERRATAPSADALREAVHGIVAWLEDHSGRMSHNDGLARRLRAALTSSQSSTTSAIKDRSDEITFTDDDPAPASGLTRVYLKDIEMGKEYILASEADAAFAHQKELFATEIAAAMSKITELSAALAVKDREIAEWKLLTESAEYKIAAERERADKMEYRHYCDRGHERIGLLDKDGPDDGCPLCAERERAERYEAAAKKTAAERVAEIVADKPGTPDYDDMARQLTEARESLAKLVTEMEAHGCDFVTPVRALLARIDGKEETR